MTNDFGTADPERAESVVTFTVPHHGSPIDPSQARVPIGTLHMDGPMIPKARESHLLVHQVEDEMVVYDRKRKLAHRLNEAAAKVWSRLDGERTVSEIAADLEVDDNVVALAVDHLADAQLLESSEPLSVSRRSALRRFATAAAIGVLLPVVTSIPAPLAAMAQSGGGHGQKGHKRPRRPRRLRWPRRRRGHKGG